MKYIFLLLVSLHLSSFVSGQSNDSIQTPSYFSGIITATNNGVSLLPNFTLDKPAVLFDLSVGKGRISFDPMLRFSWTGKPWTFVFWWRYKIFNQGKFRMNVGAHPAYVFRTVTATTNGKTRDYLNALPYFAWEATPTYYFNSNVAAGVYYLGSRGLDENTFNNTSFIALKGIFTDVKLTQQLLLSLVPQVYYLQIEDMKGTYVSSIVSLRNGKFPVSLSSIISQKIKSDIAGSDLVWNIQLSYFFNNLYHRIPDNIF